MTLRAVLSLGSNVGDSRALVAGVRDRAASEGILDATSALYATPPWGGVEQDDFLNCVLLVRRPGTPTELLRWCQECEDAAGRTREVRWGPRTLDVDVVAAWADDDREVLSDDPELTLPHPRAAERAFVLVPWSEVDPRAELDGRPVADLLAALPAGEVAAVRCVGAVGSLDARETAGER